MFDHSIIIIIVIIEWMWYLANFFFFFDIFDFFSSIVIFVVYQNRSSIDLWFDCASVCVWSKKLLCFSSLHTHLFFENSMRENNDDANIGTNIWNNCFPLKRDFNLFDFGLRLFQSSEGRGWNEEIICFERRNEKKKKKFLEDRWRSKSNWHSDGRTIRT